MTDRERLVEVLKKAPLCNKDFDLQYSDGTIEKIADHILADGWIRPPCNIGDTLYDASEYIHGVACPEIYELESDRMIIEKIENGDYLFTYDDMYVRHEDIGKTIFLTREEAEKALRGGGEQ